MIPLFKVGMSDEAPKKVTEVLTSGFIGQGEVVEQFEDALHKELKTKVRPVTVNSCTSAIDLALELIGVGPGDEIIATPQTCFASQVGAIHRHARIRWADIDPITGLIDYQSVAKLITSKTKAIICVNWAGKICDFEKLKSFGKPVIEDAAHSWDVFLDSPVERGDYTCYSLQAIKFLTSGDGGVLICPTEQKAEEARILRWFGLDRTKGQSFRCTQNIQKAGFKYHMNDINATIGLYNMPLARESVSSNRKNAKFIIENVKNDRLTLPSWDDTCSYWLFSMHVDNKDVFTQYMHKNEIAVSPVHFRNDMYDCTKDFIEDELPNVTKFDKTQICIPVGFWLSEDDLNHIVKTLNEYQGNI